MTDYEHLFGYEPSIGRTIELDRLSAAASQSGRLKRSMEPGDDSARGDNRAASIESGPQNGGSATARSGDAAPEQPSPEQFIGETVEDLCELVERVMGK